jgi:hypothetical protein
MFVRFSRKKLENGAVSLRVELVESYRDARKGDAPRNRYIAYLGSIIENDPSPLAQLKFYRSFEARLARLHISTDDEKMVREKVQARIPEKSWSDIVTYLSRFSRRSAGVR